MPDLPADRRWRGVRMALAVLLPAVLAGGSGVALMSDSPIRAGGSREQRPASEAAEPPRDRLGVTGLLPREPAPGRELLEDASDPRALATGAGPMIERPRGPLDIPAPMLAAYRDGAQEVSSVDPSCGLHWSLLASIGRIESGHARSGRIDAQGTTVSAILGPRLNGGREVAAIRDTDDGRYDGDPAWDRAVGPMQFIPSTWERHGVDGNDDGVASPHNVHDSVVTAGRYLCAGDVDMRDEQDRVRAVFRYNHSQSYVREVLLWAEAYRDGVRPRPVEVAPDVDRRDVLAGHRLSYRPLRLEPAPAPAASPRAAAPPPAAPAPRSTASSGPRGPAPTSSAPASRPPTSPAPSPTPTPPEGAPPPPSSEPAPSRPPSSSPPSSEPPSSEPPSSEPPPSSTPPLSSTPPSSQPPSSEPPEPCEPALLDSGEFVTDERREEAEPGLEPGTTEPAEAEPGEVVHVDEVPEDSDGGGALRSCRVPSDYVAPE